MEGINSLQKGMSKIQISPEKKLLFMKMVFDKLDPTLIEAILNHHKWSVEGALDDLLAREDERCKIEAEQRRQLELQRWQQYEAERQRFLAQQQDLERRNMVFNLRAIFPHIAEQVIQQALASYGWSYKDAYSYLYPFEMQAVQAEQYERQRKEEEFRQQQLKEQEFRLHQQAALAAQSDTMFQGLQNWDQLYQKFEQQEGGAAAHDQKEERRFFVDLAAQFWHLDPARVTQIYETAHWDLKAAYPILEQTSFQEFRTKLQSQFPNIPAQQIEPILSQTFPNQGKAITQLSYQSRMQLLEQAYRDCRARLDEAVKRQGQTKASFGAQQAKWAQQQAELQRVPPSERAFMESAYQMVQQKEDAHFKSLFQDHDKEIGKLQKELSDIQAEMDEKTRQNNADKTPELTPEQRLKAFEDKIASYKAQRKVDQVANVQVKKTLITEKLRNQLGEEKFQNLVRVLGEAPGGVAIGWKGPAEIQHAKPATSDIHSPRKLPTAAPAPSTTAPPCASALAKAAFAPPTVPNPQFQQSTGVPATASPYPPQGYSSTNLPAPPVPTTQQYGAPPVTTTQQYGAPQPTNPSPAPSGSSNVPAGYPPGYPPNYSNQPPANPGFASSSYGAPAPAATNQPAATQTSYSAPQVIKDEVTQFAEWFAIADQTRSGYIGMQDASFFRRSLLPDNVLAEVWRLSSNGTGKLDRNQFALALNLIYLAQIRAPLSLEILAQQKATNQPMIPYLKFD